MAVAIKFIPPRVDISATTNAQSSAPQLPAAPGYRVFNAGTTVADVCLLSTHEAADGDGAFAAPLRCVPIAAGSYQDFVNDLPSQFVYANAKMRSGSATISFSPMAFK